MGEKYYLAMFLTGVAGTERRRLASTLCEPYTTECLFRWDFCTYCWTTAKQLGSRCPLAARVVFNRGSPSPTVSCPGCHSGVYQEVMGSIHNMFGSLNTVVVRAGEPQQPTDLSASCMSCMSLDSLDGQRAGEGFVVERVVRGETIAEVLSRAHHHSHDMINRQVLAVSSSHCRMQRI